MQNKKIEISVVITAHHEGRLAHHTICSVIRSVTYAKSLGIQGEIIVVMDKPNLSTEQYFSKYKSSDLLIDVVSFGDPGPSRNHGVKRASGSFVAFLDADDLIGESWLAKAYFNAKSAAYNVIFYPEYVINFEGKNLILKPKGTGDDGFRAADLIEFNCWNSVHFLASKQLLIEHPFDDTPVGSGFGYEDWHWYCDSVAMGCSVEIVEGTCVFYRCKSTGSRLTTHNESLVVCPPSKLFEPDIYAPFITENSKSKPVSSQGIPMKDKLSTAIARRLLKVIDKFYERLEPVFITPVYRRFPFIRRLASVIVAVGREIPPSLFNLPEWLIHEWKQINKLEPKTFPDSWLLASIPHYSIPESNIAKPYLELSQKLHGELEYLFLIPWLKRGGSDLVTINYIKALTSYVSPDAIAIISDLDSDSPWAEKLPAGVRFIEFGRAYSYLSEDNKEKLLTKFLLQKGPKRIHNINSNLGYRVFNKFGKALSNISQLYITTFCPEPTEEGKLSGYPFTDLPVCYENLQAVYFENETFLQQIKQTFAFADNLYVHYTPVQLAQKGKYCSKIKDSLHVLWAGRLDRQKRPDLLIEIAKKCLNLPFTFHVYGESLLNKDIYSKELSTLANVCIYGSFDGFSSLPLEKFDVLLYTSQWDGLPTALLEAMAQNLPVIAPKVGGIPELVINGKTGFLIDPFDSIDLYLEGLKIIFSNPEVISEIVENAHILISKRHSYESFNNALHQFPGYIETSTAIPKVGSL